MALLFLGVGYPSFLTFPFSNFTNQIAVTSSPITSGLQIHPTTIHWIIRLGGNASLITNCNRS